MPTNETPIHEYQFEIETILTQFIALVDNAVVMRYEKDAETGERRLAYEIMPTYVIGPKQRILQHLVNKAKNYTLPCINIQLTGVKADKDRMLDKTGRRITGYRGGETEGYARPVPVTLSVKMTVIAKLMSDIYQIFAKVATQFQPYCVYSWVVPHLDGYGLEELRNKVEWDMNFNIEAREQLNEGDEERYTGTFGFQVQGWIFPEPKRCVEGVILDIGTSVVSETDVEARTDFGGLEANKAFRPLVDGYLARFGRYGNPREFANGHPRLLKAFARTGRYDFRILPGEGAMRDFAHHTLHVNGYNLAEADAFLVPGAGFEGGAALVPAETLDYGEAELFPLRAEGAVKGHSFTGHRLPVVSRSDNNLVVSLEGAGTGSFDVVVASRVDFDPVSDIVGGNLRIASPK